MRRYLRTLWRALLNRRPTPAPPDPEGFYLLYVFKNGRAQWPVTSCEVTMENRLPPPKFYMEGNAYGEFRSFGPYGKFSGTIGEVPPDARSE